MPLQKIICLACASTRSVKHRQHCHECGGKGFNEVDDGKCTHLPPMHISYDPMVDGWECQCGASGPITKDYAKRYSEAVNANTK